MGSTASDTHPPQRCGASFPPSGISSSARAGPADLGGNEHDPRRSLSRKEETSEVDVRTVSRCSLCDDVRNVARATYPVRSFAESRRCERPSFDWLPRNSTPNPAASRRYRVGRDQAKPHPAEIGCATAYAALSCPTALFCFTAPCPTLRGFLWLGPNERVCPSRQQSMREKNGHRVCP
jgi:hypothetical protein